MRALSNSRWNGDGINAAVRTLMAGLFTVSLVGCDSSQSAALDQDEQAIRMVKAANKLAPPIEMVQPDPLLAEDIKRHDLTAPNCTFSVGTNLAPRVIAREADAYMKYDGTIHRFAADPGARTLIGSVRSVYNGRAHVLRLELEDRQKASAGGTPSDNSSVEGLIELRDPHGRVVYSGQGFTECG